MADEIDQIIETMDSSTNSEIPMSGPETAEKTQTPEPPPQQIQEFSFNADGREIKVPFNDPRIKQWAAMGYSAPNKFGQLNSQLEKFKTEQQKLEETYKPYREMDEWSRKNPQAWQELDSLWRQKLSGMTPQQKADLPPEVKQEIQAIKEGLSEIQQEKIEQRNRVADQTLDQEIGSIRKAYPNLDLHTPDQNGNSLEYKVLQHGIQNGIPNFTAAFRDYCFDHLTKMAEEKGREGAGKSLSKAKSLGLQGKSPAPNGQMGRAQNLRNKSYEDLTNELFAELGIG